MGILWIVWILPSALALEVFQRFSVARFASTASLQRVSVRIYALNADRVTSTGAFLFISAALGSDRNESLF
ncbi:hypothetical protein AOLI_G00248890 [Acnodon oligacanthus]